jgi:hypothetical protein
MGPLTALLLATPIFGFALAPPDVAAISPAAAAATEISAPFSLEASAELEASVDSEGGAEANAESSSAGPKTDQAAYVVQLRKRAKIAKVHRTLGIVTWASMLVTVATGTVQYRNLYGAPFVTGLADTPCVKGNAWPNQEQCYGSPLPHAIPGFVTAGFYFTTLGLAMAMPDPDHASVGTSKYAKNVRTHKALRWVHLTGMVTQIVLGIIMANPRLGLDRSNDYDTLKILSGVHLASGYITLGALTWAGTIMLL